MPNTWNGSAEESVIAVPLRIILSSINWVTVPSSLIINSGIDVVESSVISLPPITETNALPTDVSESVKLGINLIPSPIS